MKNKLLLSLFIAIIGSNTVMCIPVSSEHKEINRTQQTKVSLHEIINDTRQTIEYDKLPAPGLLGKIQPIAIQKKSKQVFREPITSLNPLIITLKNQDSPKYTISIEFSINKGTIMPIPESRIPMHEITEIHIIMKDKTGKTFKQVTEKSLRAGYAYNISLEINSKNLKKIDVNIMSHEIPRPL